MRGSFECDGNANSEPVLPVMVVSSALNWILNAASRAWRTAPFTLAVIVLAPSGTASWWLALVALLADIYIGFTLVKSFPTARAALLADTRSLTLIRGHRQSAYPMSSIQRFVKLKSSARTPREIGIVALVDQEALIISVPMGKGTRRSKKLLVRLERLRRWTVEHSMGGDLRSSEYDPLFRPPRIPRGPTRWVLPAALFAVGPAMLVAIPFGYAADQNASKAIQARSARTVGTVTAIYTSDPSDPPTRQRTAVIRFETNDGPLTTDITIDRSEESGSKKLDLLYDPMQPTRVWRYGGQAPSDSGSWLVLLIFAAWVPPSLGFAQWLRWHPPDGSFNEERRDTISSK